MTAAVEMTPTRAEGWNWRFAGATGPFMGLVVMIVFLSLATDTFFSLRNFLNVMDQITVIGIMAIGMTMVILIGGIDLSVGSVLALSAMVMGYLGNHLGVPFPRCDLARTYRLGDLRRGIGAHGDGPEHAGLHRHPCDDVDCTRHREHHYQWRANYWLSWMVLGPGDHSPLRFPNRHGRDHDRPHPGILGLSEVPARRTALYAIGGSPEVARLAGIRVKAATVWVYTFSGLMAGLAGVILSARLDSAQPSQGLGYELDTIAAVVIGGTSLTGGIGGISGTAVGVLIIGFLRNGLNLLHVSPFVQQIIIGLVIAVAVSADTLRTRRR